MIILAHDGSIYSDWVARYALRFALAEKDRKLLVLHVQDGKIAPDIVTARFDQLADECAERNVEFLPQRLPMGASVHRTLRQAIPPDPETLLLCGTRVKPRRQSYFAGTISEKLLRMHQCPVLALRVVQPGLLGNPHDLLLSFAGHQNDFSHLAPIMRRLAPQLRFVQLCRVMRVNALRYPELTAEIEQALKQKGKLALQEIQAEMNHVLSPVPFRCDHRVIIASDWGHELLMQASRLKSQLLLLGVSEHSLAYRVFHSLVIERILHKSPCDVGLYRSV